jgi:RNA polymerase sigma-70 factor (ECF subfamily)
MPILSKRTREHEPDRSLLQDLVRRAREGDRAAFEQLVRAHFERLYRVLFRLAGNHEDAEDLTQECFVRAWSNLRWYREEAVFETWLRRIAVHLARDHHRSRTRRRNRDALATDPGAPPPRARAASDEAHRREMLRALRASIDRLPQRLRESFVLRVLGELEYDEVADAVGIAPATARTHVMKARRLLARWMEPWLEGSDA